MDLLNDKIKPVYLRYLAASFGSALIVSIYSMVDMAMVGQYEGPNGAAALAVVAPVWNLIYSLGMLTGAGGSVIYSIIKGQSEKRTGLENEYFTVAVTGSLILAAMAWLMLIFFEAPLLMLFGADETLLPLAQDYVRPIKTVLPLFLINYILAAFLRNDNNPGLATIATLAGGVFNMFGDYFFVFTCDMGVFGAGLATALGSAITFAVTMLHFVSKNNTLKLVKPSMALRRFKEITVTGFSTFFVDVATGILTILFNRQIMKYLGANALAVYGPIVNVSMLVQCCAYSIGNAAQPIMSINFGAKKWKRITETLKYAVITAVAFGLLWTFISLIYPNIYIYIFMKPTELILDIAPAIIRRYGISFLVLPFNIFSTYYFQSVMKAKASFLISVLRGFAISGGLIMLLPVIAGADSIWFAMPITELVTAVLAIYMILRYTKKLSAEKA